jgi:hypothetical protein
MRTIIATITRRYPLMSGSAALANGRLMHRIAP